MAKIKSILAQHRFQGIPASSFSILESRLSPDWPIVLPRPPRHFLAGTGATANWPHGSCWTETGPGHVGPLSRYAKCMCLSFLTPRACPSSLSVEPWPSNPGPLSLAFVCPQDELAYLLRADACFPFSSSAAPPSNPPRACPDARDPDPGVSIIPQCGLL